MFSHHSFFSLALQPFLACAVQKSRTTVTTVTTPLSLFMSLSAKSVFLRLVVVREIWDVWAESTVVAVVGGHLRLRNLARGSDRPFAFKRGDQTMLQRLSDYDDRTRQSPRSDA